MMMSKISNKLVLATIACVSILAALTAGWMSFSSPTATEVSAPASSGVPRSSSSATAPATFTRTARHKQKRHVAPCKETLRTDDATKIHSAVTTRTDTVLGTVVVRKPTASRRIIDVPRKLIVNISTAPIECGSFDRLAAGYYWDTTSSACVRIPRWTVDLRSFETSEEEMFCETLKLKDANEKKKEKMRSSQLRWYNSPFRFVKHGDAVRPESVIEHFSLRHEKKHESHSAAPEKQRLLDRYSRFMYKTSWLFRQWAPWEPRIVAAGTTTASAAAATFAAATANASSSSTKFHSFHDPDLENIFRISNFCLSPFSSAVSGFVGGPHIGATKTPPVRRFGTYSGKDDSRGVFENHADKDMARFLSQPVRRDTPPEFLDERPVIFVPLTHSSRWNLAHTLNRVLAVIGILKVPFVLVPQHADPSTANLSNAEISRLEESAQPLIVFLSDAHGFDPAIYKRQTAAWGMFFRALDLPWAVVMRVERDHSSSSLSGFMQKMNAKTDHNDFDVFGETDDGQQDEVCFKYGVAYQNCFQCTNPLLDADERSSANSNEESYSFSMWAQPTQQRTALIRDYRSLMGKCLPSVFPSLTTLSSSSSSMSRFPRVLFDLRTRSRRIANIGVFMDEIRDGLRGYIDVDHDDDSLIFREPGRGSRSEYLRDLRRADIWIGVHGASLSHISLMKEKSVVVELSSPYFYINGEARPGTWFDIFTKSLDLDHWVVEVDATLERWSDIVYVPPQYLVETIREAACRWFSRRGGDETSPTKSGNVVPPCACHTDSRSSIVAHRAGQANTPKKTELYKLDRTAYRASVVQSVLRSFFGISTVSGTQADAVAEKLLRIRGHHSSITLVSHLPEVWTTLMKHLYAYRSFDETSDGRNFESTIHVSKMSVEFGNKLVSIGEDGADATLIVCFELPPSKFVQSMQEVLLDSIAVLGEMSEKKSSSSSSKPSRGTCLFADGSALHPGHTALKGALGGSRAELHVVE